MDGVANGTRKRRGIAQSRKRPGPKPARRRRPLRQRLGFWLRLLGHFAAYVGVFTLLVCAIYMPGAVSAQRTDADLQERGEPAMGMVVEVKHGSTPHSRPGGVSTTYYPVTEQGAGGAQTTWPKYQSTREGRWAVGQRLPLLYDPIKPSRMTIDTPEASELLTGKVDSYKRQLLLGSILTVVGVPLIFLARRLDPSPRPKGRKKTASPQVLPRQKQPS